MTKINRALHRTTEPNLLRFLRYVSLNIRGLISLLMMDWGKRENINTVALVTIVQCYVLGGL